MRIIFGFTWWMLRRARICFQAFEGKFFQISQIASPSPFHSQRFDHILRFEFWFENQCLGLVPVNIPGAFDAWIRPLDSPSWLYESNTWHNAPKRRKPGLLAQRSQQTPSRTLQVTLKQGSSVIFSDKLRPPLVTENLKFFRDEVKGMGEECNY